MFSTTGDCHLFSDRLSVGFLLTRLVHPPALSGHAYPATTMATSMVSVWSSSVLKFGQSSRRRSVACKLTYRDGERPVLLRYDTRELLML